MSKLLSFVAGAAKGFSEMVDASEKSAKEEAALRVSRLMATHKEVMESNLKLENELKAEEGWIKTYFSNATPEQIQFLQANPPALQAIKSMDNPTQLGDLGNIIKIANANKAASVTQDQITQLPIVAAEVTSRLKEKARSTGFFRNLADEAGERVGITTERSLARGLGTTVEQMESIKRTARPSIEGTFDVAKTLEKTPSSVEDMVKTANVARVQAKQKFGEGSAEYKAANETFTSLSGEIKKAETKLEDRRDRLEIERNDNKDDPILVAALTKEINGINADIKARREATSTKSERAGTGGSADAITYSKAKTRVEDYMNTDMITNKGLGWRKYVEEKVVTDPATGKSITIPGKKVGLNPEQEKEYIEGMTQARMQGLKDLGLVTEKGQPINNEVKSLMTAYGLNRPTQTPAPTQTTAPAQAPKSAVSVDAARAEARAAIAKGANAAAVAKRFKETTGQEL
jgi:hypothetical protein